MVPGSLICLQLVIGLIVAVMIFVVYVNVWYRRERAKMTTQERAREDAEMRMPGNW
jgi:hypothetical protein